MQPRMRVTAEFEGGSAGDWEVAAPGRVRVTARADGSPRPLWFYFHLEETGAPEVIVELTNADQCLGPRHGWNTVRPVYQPLAAGAPTQPDAWRRCPPGRYEPAPAGGIFRFVVPSPSGSVAVAYSYPYTLSDLERFRSKNRPAVRWSELDFTAGGHAVLLATLGDAARRAVWVLARQHAGETPSSYVAEGLLDWLGSAERSARDALAGACFRVAPMVDVDGVCAGRFGKDAAPLDINRDWRDQPAHPEIGALIRACEQAARRAPPALFLDLHASHHGNTTCFLFSEAGQQREREFLARLEAAGPAAVGFRRSDVRREAAPPGSARDYFARRFGALSLCIEMSYHLAQGGRYLTPRDYRDFGAALAQAAARWIADSYA